MVFNIYQRSKVIPSQAESFHKKLTSGNVWAIELPEHGLRVQILILDPRRKQEAKDTNIHHDEKSPEIVMFWQSHFKDEKWCSVEDTKNEKTLEGP